MTPLTALALLCTAGLASAPHEETRAAVRHTARDKMALLEEEFERYAV